MRISDWSSDVCSSDLGAVAADVAGHLAAAGRMADEDRVFEVQMLDQRRQVVGVGIHLVAVPGLAGAAVAAAIMAKGALALGGEEQPRRLPGIGPEGQDVAAPQRPIGRASCRERVGQYV